MAETYVITPAAQAAVPVTGGRGLFPVRRVYCIGRNYAAHAREMGAAPGVPFFFMKPADAVFPVGEGARADVPFPPETDNYHHEVELVVALKSGGRDVSASEALAHVYGYAIGLDMTRRDRQQDMKDKAWPWEIGKAADHSAPCGPIHPVSEVGHRSNGAISLSVDGVTRQNSDLSMMIWPVAEQIAVLSRHYELKAGDLIFSGTPEGVGAVKRGQTMTCAIAGLGEIGVRVV